jgi:hypothetical protein
VGIVEKLEFSASITIQKTADISMEISLGLNGATDFSAYSPLLGLAAATTPGDNAIDPKLPKPMDTAFP